MTLPTCSPCFFHILFFMLQLLSIIKGCNCYRQLARELNNVLIDKIVADIFTEYIFMIIKNFVFHCLFDKGSINSDSTSSPP